MDPSQPYTVHSITQGMADPAADAAAGRSRTRWRAIVFVPVFLALLAAGLWLDYSRPAVFLATASISVGSADPQADADPAGQRAALEAQAVRRSELVEAVAQRLRGIQGNAAPSALALQQLLAARPVPGTPAIELRAEGPDRALLLAALGAWIDAYASSRKDTDTRETGDSLEQAREQARLAKAAAERKRGEVAEFRRRNNVMASERDQNPGAVRLAALLKSLDEASGREVAAEARLADLGEALKSGATVVRAADKQAITALELRAEDLRVQVQKLRDEFTDAYLDLDSKAKALKTDLARIEQQLEREIQRSRQAALAEAKSDLSKSRQVAEKLRQQAAALEQESGRYSERMAEQQRITADLDRLEEDARAATARLEGLENAQNARRPAVTPVRVLAAPSAADEPVRPDYTRDAGIAAGAALLASLLVVWLVQFLWRGADPAPVQPVAQPIIQIAYPVMPQGRHVQLGPAPVSPHLLAHATSPAAARELSDAELMQLWKGAPGEARVAIAALMTGVTLQDLALVRWSDVNFDAGTLFVPGPFARARSLVEPLRAELASLAYTVTGERADLPVLRDGAGQALSAESLESILACAAHDAGWRDSVDSAAEALFHTYLCHLARQGARMSDIARFVGRLDSAAIAQYSRMAPPGEGRAFERLDLVHPAFRTAAPS